MTAWLALLLFVSVSFAQPARMKVLQWDFPSNELASVFFWIERKDGIEKPWRTMAVVDPQSGTNAMAFYQVGLDWRTNAPAWMTNFQFMEVPPEAAKAKSLLTAGEQGGEVVNICSIAAQNI